MEYTKTTELETNLAQFTRSRFITMLPNGTLALLVACLALGLKAGDEVLVPNLTMIATANAPYLIGIQPILVDIDQETLCMDLDRAAEAITTKTKALIYVSLNGRSGDMHQVTEFCKKNKLLFIEDAAQSLGSSWHNQSLGTFGEVGVLSFSVPKIITTGQGGALLTNSQSIYEKIKKIKDFGRVRGGSDVHNEFGWNFKFTDLLSVVGIEQMKKLPKRIVRKKAIYKLYSTLLSQVPKLTLIQTDLSLTTPWFIDIYVSQPDKLAAYLASQGIGTRRIYPALSTQKIYQNSKASQGVYPVSQKMAATGLWLPSASTLTDHMINRICKLIIQYYAD
jgi:perosamine synthetase